MNERESTYAVADRAGAQISRAVPTPRGSHLSELSKMLEEVTQQAAEVSGRLRNNTDSLLGSEPEPGNTNGASKPLPPASGQVNQLLETVRAINATLREARHQLDRLDSL